MVRAKGMGSRQLRSSSFTNKILGLLFILFALSAICNILGLRLHLNDTVASNYRVTFDAPIPDRIHPRDNSSTANRDGSNTQFLDNDKEITSKPVTKPWESSKSAVLGLASGLSFNIYEQFVGSLRATGFSGHIILGVGPNLTSKVLDLFKQHNVTTYVVEPAKCTYNGTKDMATGKILNVSGEVKCLKAYPDYKITWARFLLYRDWLLECPTCSDGVMLTDVRDAFFQSDPFVATVQLKQQAPLMLFEEHPNLTNTHLLTNFPVTSCRNYRVGETRMLCSGSTMGSREGILDYISVMVEEFDYWKTRQECRLELKGDDQSIHNYLYYTNRFHNAVTIPHRTGAIHVVGYEAARIFKIIEKEGRTKQDHQWNTWLPEKYGLIDYNKTGYILNLDGYASPQVHQIDRFGNLLGGWRHKIIHTDHWRFSTQELFCTRDGSKCE